jgi:hypothetical protein
MQKNLAEKIAAEYGQYEEESTLQLDAMGGGEPAGPRTIQVQVACMSRAGREPGYKKTNQDNCFAFEKFIGEDQSLFGAMDGHGPHGAAPHSTAAARSATTPAAAAAPPAAEGAKAALATHLLGLDRHSPAVLNTLGAVATNPCAASQMITPLSIDACSC